MNSNQYLRPEDLPITDAKKSPLALLAMTCSNIGADLLGTGKPMNLGYKGSKKSQSHVRVDSDANESSRPDSASSDKTQAKSADTNRSSSTNSYGAVSEHSDNGHHQQQQHHSSSNSNQRHSNNHSVGGATSTSATSIGSSCKISFKPYENVPCTKSSTSTTNSDRSRSATSSNSDAASASVTINGLQSDAKDANNIRKTSSPSSKGHSTPRPSTGSPKTQSDSSKGHHHNGSSGSSELSKSGHHHNNNNHAHQHSIKQDSEMKVPVSLAGYHGHFPAHLTAEQEQLLKSAYQHQAAAMAAMGKAPPCADPYCRGCQLSLAGVPTNTPCNSSFAAACQPHPSALGYHPYSSALAGLQSPFASGRFPSLGGGGNGGGAGLPGTPGRPFTCSWTAGGAYCGKTFGTSEELLQHLKSHTSFSPGLAALGQYPHLDPMLTSPVAGLRRTAFDPVNRYHPYKNFGGPQNPLQSFLNPSSAMAGGLNPHAMASLGLHYPPAAYGPYAGRLGAPIPP
ncbi:hypothetical protein HDE_07583 [Halotydeus destructor]|nr:hypothetical protein HDE_07583 [Halotydeus destructor]